VNGGLNRAIILRPAFGEGYGRTITARPAARSRSVDLRSATVSDAAAIHRLIVSHATEGRLLPRTLEEVTAHIERFVVAAHNGDDILGCADLAPLSASVAEVRSLVVDPAVRAHGIGRRLLRELTLRAHASGYTTLCSFTHSPGYFVQSGFSVVPHAWLPEKIERDCKSCPLFRQCGQYAMSLPLPAFSAHGVGAVVNG
jgi:amino-acid N-acetyltransferase